MQIVFTACTNFFVKALKLHLYKGIFSLLKSAVYILALVKPFITAFDILFNTSKLNSKLETRNNKF